MELGVVVVCFFFGGGGGPVSFRAVKGEAGRVSFGVGCCCCLLSFFGGGGPVSFRAVKGVGESALELGVVVVYFLFSGAGG